MAGVIQGVTNVTPVHSLRHQPFMHGGTSSLLQIMPKTLYVASTEFIFNWIVVAVNTFITPFLPWCKGRGENIDRSRSF